MLFHLNQDSTCCVASREKQVPQVPGCHRRAHCPPATSVPAAGRASAHANCPGLQRTDLWPEARSDARIGNRWGLV